MRPEEKIIQEQRTIEATNKNLMGIAGKFGLIAKYSGSEIVAQSNHVSQTFLDDPYDIENDTEEKMPLMEDESMSTIGYIFDALSSGYHIEIQCKEANKEIIVYYKGYKVYHEISGDLLSYAPFEEWEDIINRLYRASKIRKQKFDKKAKEVKQKENQKNKKSFLQVLRYRWGI